MTAEPRGNNCDGSVILLDLGEQCLPLNAGLYVSSLETPNNDPNASSIPGLVEAGLPGGCFRDDILAGMRLLGNLHIFDGPSVGDISMVVVTECAP